MALACCSWVAFGLADARLRASIRAEKLWMCASFDAAWLIGAASYPVVLFSVRLPLRTASSKADAGVIQIMVTPRSARPPVPAVIAAFA